MVEETLDRWKIADSTDLYEIERWGKGYFSIAESGNLLVHPDRQSHGQIDLKALVESVQDRGLDLPVLIRFNGILEDRLREIRNVFAKAIDEQEYHGKYAMVYPIKVNQQRHVVEQMIRHGSPYGFGLEAGSKPELLAVVAMIDSRMPIICNGFKDPEFIEMALLAQKMGRRVLLIVERFKELERILDCADRVGVRPTIGIRVKLMSRGSGKWQASGGFRSKFGLTIAEVLEACDQLESRDMTDCLELVHFHLGSQITNIRRVKSALNEAARIYCDLANRGMRGLKYIDVGGGLGVDYDGSQTDFESSMNYTLQEYANDVIYHIKTVCDEAEVPHPDIYSESGRAAAAYHSVLVFSVLGYSEQGRPRDVPESLPDAYEQPVHMLFETLNGLSMRNMRESFHDAQQSLEMTNHLFSTGHINLEQRGDAERLFWAICRRIHKMLPELEYVPDELAGLDQMLSDTLFCNFSLFQSLPDSWAIKQLFPIIPIHRLNERPDRHAVLADITCDSDGKIDRFINRRDVKRSLRVHSQNDSPYYLAAFLTGAYQEILGDLHNLFGDTNAVHVELNENGEVALETIIKGDTVSEVLKYVQFEDNMLTSRIQAAVERAVQEGRLNNREAGHMVRFYEESLYGYTYLEEPREP
ncbi:MAG: biosynthetic arginine decarboxylase [Planctomycetota bacterium]